MIVACLLILTDDLREVIVAVVADPVLPTHRFQNTVCMSPGTLLHHASLPRATQPNPAAVRTAPLHVALQHARLVLA